jgi:hypothetical protein
MGQIVLPREVRHPSLCVIDLTVAYLLLLGSWTLTNH